MFFILISIIILLYILNDRLYNNEKSKLLSTIPGPKTKFLVGNTLDILTTPTKLFYIGRNHANTFNGKYLVQFPDRNAIFMYNPEDIEVVLSSPKHITKEDLYYFVHPWLGTGLLTSTGEKWHSRRKILTPAFHFNILKQFCKIFVDHSENLIVKLKRMEGQDVDMLPFITDLTLQSICETAMGTTLDLTRKKAIDYKNAVYELGKLILHRMLRLWLHPSFVFNRTSVGKYQNTLLKTLHTFTKDVVDERRKNRASSGEKFAVGDYTEDRENGEKKRLAMLDLLLSAESEGKIDDDGIREEVDTFMFEGHDTTTNALMYTMMLLANNPEAQQLAYEEVNSVLGKDTDTIGIETLNNLKYLERCIKESLRLYPSVPFFGRQIEEDVKLGEHLVPANTICEIHVFDLHRDPKLYPNPGKFDPDRFLPENCAKRHNYAYIPFSAGPRNCIGQKYAMLEIKTVISIVLQNFTLEAVTKPNDIVFYTDVVLRTKTPIRVKFSSRN